MSAEVEMRAGDGMRHTPSGEEWVFAYRKGDRIAWLSWSIGEAPASDFELVARCTDKHHTNILKMMRESSSAALREAALAQEAR